MPLKTVNGTAAQPHKGRGAGLNLEGRFESLTREGVDDGWYALADKPEAQRTTVSPEQARSIITRNDSPDVPFTYSINPYRGCEHGCVYCLAGDTPVLMGDGTTRPIADLRPDDIVYGTRKEGPYRRYVRSRVLAHWRTIKAAYRIVLEDGTTMAAGGDHRFLTERGWKFVTDRHDCNGRQRARLTVNNRLMGTGRFAVAPSETQAYKAGYLCGMVRGDALLGTFRYERAGRQNGDQHQFRLALCDGEALDRTSAYLQDWQIKTWPFLFQAATENRKEMRGVRTSSKCAVELIREIIKWPEVMRQDWAMGFLAGIFDAEGSFSQGVLRISNTDPEIISWTARALRAMRFRFVLERPGRPSGKPVTVVRIVGGLREHLRFFHQVNPCITRKRDIAGIALKSDAKLGVVSIERMGRAHILYDITTETGDFIANGVVSHNCYARPSHAYLELSPGLDFETRLFAKVNAADKLREELARPGHKVEPIAIGVNTDCYQPIEREWKITRQVLEVLAETRHPCTIVTKNALVTRDLDLLSAMARQHLVQVFITVTTLDAELARRMEPRASAPHSRLAAIRRLADAGVPVGAMVAPVIPFLTDSGVEAVLEAVSEAGAESAAYVLMRLPWELKELFKDWLETHYPLKAAHVMSRVREMRGGRETDPRFGKRMSGEGLLAELLRKRFAIACQRLRLNQERRRPLDCSLFRPPRVGPQLDLFG